MADTADVRSGLTIFLQKKAATRLRNTLFNIMPTLEFCFALNGDKKASEGLGRPKTDVMISAANGVAASQRIKIYTERSYKPLIQTTKPSISDARAMADYGSDPTVPNWDTTNRPMERYTQPEFKFARIKMPYKVPHSDVRTVKRSARTEGEAVAAILGVYESETRNREATLCELLNEMLFDGPNNDTANIGVGGAAVTLGQPSDQTATSYDTIFSLQQAIGSSTNTYGGVDRTVQSNYWWLPGQCVGYTATADGTDYTATARSAVFADIIDFCNYDCGAAKKGGGVQLVLVGSALFKVAKAEAKAENYQITTDGIRDFPEFGFKREVVKIFTGNRPVYIFYEPQVAAQEMFLLDPSTWTFAIHPDSNFKISTPADQTKVEGGDEADTGTIAVELMAVCEVPSLNFYFSAIGA